VVLCEAVDEQKRKASTSREQTDRAFFAKSALLWAIASGSPAFYGETVIWARRFVRDPVSTVVLKIIGMRGRLPFHALPIPPWTLLTGG
jgi:hypothetical protein